VSLAGEPCTRIDGSVEIRPANCRRLNRSHLKQRERGVTAPHANALLLAVQDTGALAVRGQVNPPYALVLDPADLGLLGATGAPFGVDSIPSPNSGQARTWPNSCLRRHSSRLILDVTSLYLWLVALGSQVIKRGQVDNDKLLLYNI